MKNLVIGIAIVSTFALTGVGQSSKSSSSAGNTTSASKSGKNVSLASNTAIAAELQNSLSAEKAKVGDEVVLKTTKVVKQNGEVVVDKGSRLIGRVTEVQKRQRGNSGSRIGIMFDTLVQDNREFSINALVTSITQVNRTRDDGDFDMSSTGSTRTSSQSSASSGGGLLGGVGSTVGGVVNTATQTVGGVTDTAGRTVGSTTGAVGENLRGLQISQAVGASADGSSTLSLGSGNIRLEKGATFNLRVSESTSNKDSNKD